jgi:hypothetical protein
MNLSCLEKELETLPLVFDEWEIFLKVVACLYKHRQLSKSYIGLRWNVGSRTVDRISTSLTHLQWAYYSLGELIISDKGSEILERLKIGNYVVIDD